MARFAPLVVIAHAVEDTCPGVGQDCKVFGKDGLACCGSEHGAGFAFCQTDPEYTCCSGASYAISCGTGLQCELSDAGLPSCGAAELAVSSQDTCPGVGQDCKVFGKDGLACCGSEHGAGFAFCQTDPDYTCCSGSSYAISCGTGLQCEVSDAGLPTCAAKELEVSVQDTCPGVGQDCKVFGKDGLACCGSEHGAGFAFCQTDPDYTCCSGASYAISCGTGLQCELSDAGLPSCGAAELEVSSQETCPGLPDDCAITGADGLSCCGAEHGPGFAFCQTSPDYLCCSGDSYAITCSSTTGCSVTDAGIPVCQKKGFLV